MTPPPGTVRLTVLVGEGDAVGHAPLHTEMVHRTHAAGLRGCRCLPGYRGLRARQRRPHERLLDLSGDLPGAVVIADEATRVRGLLDGATESWQTGPVTVEDMTVVGPPGGNHPG